jgi:DNA modification methylase
MINKIHNEPCLETLKKMPSDFLDCVISSPPYWQLRDYGYDGQWGLEPTFQKYLEHLWEMMDEIYRVLKPTGTCWINLGDTYARGSRAKYAHSNQSLRSKHEQLIEPNTKPNYEGLDKCLILIPHRFAIGCIDRGWIVRNDIIWAKRNGMPESVNDRFAKKHEYIFLMTKSKKYYFNLDAIRDKHIWESDKRNDGNRHEYNENAKSHNDNKVGAKGVSFNPNGKNPGSVSDFWDIKTKPSSVKHYASYNVELITKPILAGCPEGGLIYDPFMGSGTTAIHAIMNNRNFIGSEMSIDYLEIANKRISEVLAKPKLF